MLYDEIDAWYVRHEHVPKELGSNLQLSGTELVTDAERTQGQQRDDEAGSGESKEKRS